MTKKAKKPSKSAVTWGNRPSKEAMKDKAEVITATAAADSFVEGAKGETIRLNLNIPRYLHKRIKSQCALDGRNMTEVIMELLQTHFSQPKGA